jgi:hypothetical protein
MDKVAIYDHTLSADRMRPHHRIGAGRRARRGRRPLRKVSGREDGRMRALGLHGAKCTILTCE